MTNRSISLRLTIWFSAIFLCGFVLFGATIWLDLAYSLGQGRDRTLHRRAARFIELLEATRNDLPTVWESRFEELAGAIPEGNLIRIFDPAGHRLFPAQPSPPDFPPAFTQSAMREKFTTLQYQNRPYRLLEFPVHTKPPYVILVAGQLDDNRNIMARLTAGLTWATPVMLALSALAGYVLSRRALQPVAQISATLRSISIGSLSRRLPIAHTGDELHRLAETCNEMLARLEDSVDRINRFTADASHELRSPVALIRTVAEYALRNPNIDSDNKEAFEEILAECVEAGALLEDMLTLARADAGYGSTSSEPVNLTELVLDACVRFRPSAESRRQTLEMPAGGLPAWVSGDRSSLRRLLWILLDNAVKYTPSGGLISVELDLTSSRACITVRDNGPGIPQALLPRVFDRFVRADPSRGEVNGTGLGLAIAKSIATAHGAILGVQPAPPHGSAFTVEFHLAQRALGELQS